MLKIGRHSFTSIPTMGQVQWYWLDTLLQVASDKLSLTSRANAINIKNEIF